MEFLSNGSFSYGGTPVPVEATGGAGTAYLHWRESVFGRELMTGYLTGTTQPLSATTIGSLADLGYAVDYDAADPFDISAAALLEEPATVVPLGDDVLPGPVYQVGVDGTITPL